MSIYNIRIGFELSIGLFEASDRPEFAEISIHHSGINM